MSHAPSGTETPSQDPQGSQVQGYRINPAAQEALNNLKHTLATYRYSEADRKRLMESVERLEQQNAKLHTMVKEQHKYLEELGREVQKKKMPEEK
ncbi:hypothetical protein D8B26_005371 [Coccidioides posadasii str. Silveira]|uniref:uncharacterized protein n=1 Tax=Coccidioides posadasii (strain RMSCC 757 / Silveira) TaxID=443226 RepID=UPI001BEE5C2C|nr:hypothetical protein D8B26_005371 [Coccidioides posadasii str. Silveira]